MKCENTIIEMKNKINSRVDSLDLESQTHVIPATMESEAEDSQV